ncbi:MAG: hypothetical protein ABEI31_10720 [Halodesulfurarchaeum sp.]
MRSITLATIAIVLATLVVSAGAAAAAAMAEQVPDQAQTAEHTPDSSQSDGPIEETPVGNESTMDDGSDTTVDGPGDHVRGPPSDLPEPVPGFVSELHRLITDHLTGELGGSLGEAIRGLLPDVGSTGSGNPPG